MDARSWNVVVEDEEEEGYKQEGWKGRDFLIFMIDCSESMLETKMEDEEGLTYFENCLKVVTSMYRLRCVTCDKDYLGVLLYNTGISKNSHSFENVYVLNDLSIPDATQVKKLEAYLTRDGKKKFIKEFGHGEAKLDETFWMAGTMFSQQGMKLGTKRVMLLTNSCKPHKNDPDMQRRVIQKIKDLQEQDIRIDVIPVGDTHFDWSTFYQTALGKPAAECAEMAATQYDELLNRTTCKSYKRRAMASVSFQLGPGIEFGIGLYNLYSAAHIPTATSLDRTTNKEVTAVRTYMDAETGERVLQNDMIKYQTYGGKKIALEKDEIEQLKTNIAKDGGDAIAAGLGLPTPPTTGMVLLGFKPQSYLKPYYFIQPGLFAYPDEKSVGGSSKLFRALLEKCAARKVMAICRLVARENMAPRLVALLPQLEELDYKGCQTSPPGFSIVYLPFADDIRDLQKITDERPRVKATSEQVAKAAAIIKKLKTDNYSPENFLNPALQKHYRAVEAIALERESVEEVKDTTLPNHEWMERKAEKEIQEFISGVFSEGYSVGGAKQKKAAGGDAASKKAKIEDLDLGEEARAHRLEKITVPVLRELSSQAGIKLSGTRKADIISQINRHFKID